MRDCRQSEEDEANIAAPNVGEREQELEREREREQEGERRLLNTQAHRLVCMCVRCGAVDAPQKRYLCTFGRGSSGGGGGGGSSMLFVLLF